MQPLKSFVREIEDAIASGEDHRRAETLRRLTSLFIEQSDHLNEDHVTVFDEVISRLAKEIEFRTRVELAERLADIANAPRRTVRDLAFDADIAIAGPLIERSPRLEENDLVTIARERGQGHLLALSLRENLAEAVTDVLVVRGDQMVVRSVARNSTARFSETGFDTLVDRAAADPELHAALAERRDVPAHHFEELMAAAKARARRDLSGSGIAAGELDSALEAGADRTLHKSGPVVMLADVDAAASAIEALQMQGRLNEDALVRFVSESRPAHALAGLARLAAVPHDVVVTAYGAPHFDPLLFLLRGSRCSWATFKLFLEMKLGDEPPPALLRSAFASFQNLTVQTAQRVMRFVNAKVRVTPHEGAARQVDCS